MEARIAELSRSGSVTVRQPIEQSIARLDMEKKDAEARVVTLRREMDYLHDLATSPVAVAGLRKGIRDALSEPTPKRKTLACLLYPITVYRDHVKAGLSAVNRKPAVSTSSEGAPPERLELPT
jgi:hypothetical protein